VWIAAVSPQEAVCQGLQFSYGVAPVRAAEHPGDWSAFARRWAREEGLTEGQVVLTEGPSPKNTAANPRLEIVELDRGQHRQGHSHGPGRGTPQHREK
jgi:pyruvate kinase